MKNKLNVISGCAVMGILILIFIFCAGCSSFLGTGHVGIVTTTTPAPTTFPVTPTLSPTTFPVTTAPVPIASAAATSTETPYLTYTNPSSQLTMSYPADWQVQEIDPINCWAVRDYGKNTCNIVNFFSPTTSTGTYLTFSIDTDNPTTSNLEDYFNKVCGGLETTYPGLQVVHPFFQLKVSDNKAYELDYRKGDANNSPPAVTVVALTGNNVPYIITYTSLDDTVFENMLKSMQIPNTSGVTKQR